MPKKADVPPGSSSNPPHVKIALKKASKKINDIHKRLDELDEILEHIRCKEHRKK